MALLKRWSQACIKFYRWDKIYGYLLKNNLAIKKGEAQFKMASVKKNCEIKGGSQEMAAMV